MRLIKQFVHAGMELTMKILGLDSSGLVAGVAVTEDDNLLGEYTINYKKTHSQTLLPMLDEVAKMIELDLNTIDVIAVSQDLDLLRDSGSALQRPRD